MSSTCHGSEDVSTPEEAGTCSLSEAYGDSLGISADSAAAQLAVEQDSVALGVQSYRHQRQQADSRGNVHLLPPGHKLVVRLVGPLSDHLKDALKKSRGRRSAAIPLLQSVMQYGIDEDVIAYLTCSVALQGAMAPKEGRNSLVKMANTLGKAVLIEYEQREFKDQARFFWEKMNKSRKAFPGEMPTHLLMKMFRSAREYIDLQSLPWTVKECVKIGEWLLAQLQKSTGAIKLELLREHATRTTYQVKLAPHIMEWLDEAHSRCELLKPRYQPMIVPPVPWRDIDRGGYLGTVGANASNIVRLQNRGDSAYIDQLRDNPDQYKYVAEALNTLQETKWTVNRKVLDVVSTLWESNGTLGGLPPREDLPLPGKPHDIKTNAEARKHWKVRAKAIHMKNNRLMGARSETHKMINMAKTFAEHDVIYMPHNLDWRGRAYPIPRTLQPQGSDLAKGLLTFAERKPLGYNGAYWLAVHGAGLWGVDKVSLEERVEYIYNHEGEIVDSARDPLDGQRFWHVAEKPFQALAFCFEWARLQDHLASGSAMEDFESNLPVTMDGSCNGLQHFSALLRDPVGGAAVNLVPSDRPADIYSEVARVVADKLAADFEPETVDLSRALLPWISRKVVKQPVMTLPYGVTRYGMREQINDSLRDAIEAANEPLPDDFSKLVSHLTNMVFTSIGEVVIAAERAMSWLQEVAKVMVTHTDSIEWVTPVGFPVKQNYRKRQTHTIDSFAFGKRLRITAGYAGSQVDNRKHVASLSPNFVHSLDAAHMMLTVLNCAEHGVDAFSCVHDSYGVHAGNAEIMYLELRKAFVTMYSDDILADFRAQLEMQLPEGVHLPPVPAMGDLDIEDVMKSDYFFA